MLMIEMELGKARAMQKWINEWMDERMNEGIKITRL